MSDPTHTQLGISKSKSFELKLHKTAAKFRENAVVFVRKDLNSRKVFEMMRHKDSDHAHMAWRSVKPVFSFRKPGRDDLYFWPIYITISYFESIEVIENLGYIIF